MIRATKTALRLPLCLALASVLGACATAPAGDVVSSSVQQPFRDLNLVRDPVSEALQRALAAPYAPPAEPTCPSIAAELALLETALGPDIDASLSPGKSELPAKLVTGAIDSLIGLPFRGVIRGLSGAEKRERERRAQLLAGSIRRGFLKGWAQSVGCPAPQGG